MADTLQDKDWNRLLTRIKKGTCTPFLGAGSSYGVLPLGRDIASKWAKSYGYPIHEECKDLIKVSQFLAITEDPSFPREQIVEMITEITGKGNVPDFSDHYEPHRVLADLPLPVYITTNYDDFMVRALRSRNKNPIVELCRWKRSLRDYESVFEKDRCFEPTPANPVVFYLHGYYEVEESLVITEDDYLDFIVNISANEGLIPSRIWKALRSTSILFLGYRIADWNFRVLFRKLVHEMGGVGDKKHVSVQIAPGDEDDPEEQRKSVKRYLDSYYEKLTIHVYWGDCRRFMEELRRLWEGFTNGQ